MIKTLTRREKKMDFRPGVYILSASECKEKMCAIGNDNSKQAAIIHTDNIFFMITLI